MHAILEAIVRNRMAERSIEKVGHPSTERRFAIATAAPGAGRFAGDRDTGNLFPPVLAVPFSENQHRR